MNLCLLYTQTDKLFYNIVSMYSTCELQLLRLSLYFEKSSTGFLLTSNPRNAVPLFTVMRKLRKPFFRPENCTIYCFTPTVPCWISKALQLYRRTPIRFLLGSVYWFGAGPSESFIACDILLQNFKERTSLYFLHHG